jgi:ABC-type multidrug transport system ATPase subunit
MVDGRIVALGTPAEIGGRDTAPTEIDFVLPASLSLSDLPALDGAEVTETTPGRVRVISREGVRSAHELTGWALERGHELRGFAVSQPSLEDVYLRLTENKEATTR